MNIDTQPLPANLDAERLVLGAILTDPEAFRLISGILEADDFSIERHRRMWWRMEELQQQGKRIDRISLIHALKEADQLEHDGMSYVMSLDENMPRLHDPEGWCRIVQECAIRRRGIITCHQLMERFHIEGADVVDAAAKLFRDLGEQRQQKVDLQSLRDFISENGGLDAFLNPHRSQPVVPLPWPNLAEILGGGLRNSELIIVGGRPMHGKSAVAGQIAFHAARAGKGVPFFSLEMDADQLWYRMIAAAAQVSLQKFRKGRLHEFERVEFQSVAGEIMDYPIWISDKPNATVAAVRGALTRHKAAGNPLDLVVIDYIQLMSAAKRSDSRAQEVSEICRELKLLAKELKVPVVALAQVRRYQDSDKKPPTLDHLKESGAIEENADIVLFVWAKAADREKALEHKPALPFEIRLDVAKQRQGPVKYTSALFSPRYVRIDEQLEAEREEV